MLESLKIHHIGYLVRNIEKAKKIFTNMGFLTVQEVIYDEYRGINIAFLNKDGYLIELVSPVDENSDVESIKRKIGNSPYHICYEVDDIKSSIEKLQENRFILLHEPHDAVAINSRKVAFLMHGQIGLIEIVEKGR